MAEKILILSALLGVGFLGTRLAALLRLPHSVFMVLFGLTAGLILNRTHNPLGSGFWEAFPDVVMYALLPPLVFESAYNFNLDDLRRDLGAVVSLAVVALLISCGVIGAGLHFCLGLPLASALLFGALISATDPVAVVSLFKEVGAPRRLATIVEGESLLNDATAIVLFRVLLAAAISSGKAVGVLQGSWQFIEVSLGGIAVGGICTFVISRLLRFTSESGAGQMGLTVACAYVSFIVADDWFGVSGVISTMTVGMYLGRHARLHYNREALHGMHALWEFLALSANTLVFLAVGLSTDLGLLRGAARAIPMTLAWVYAARALSVVLTLLPLNVLRIIRPISRGYQALLIWSGLRGGLALALVLVLPHTFPHKQLFLALASSVVLTSLILNALTTVPLLRAFRLHELRGDERAFFVRSLSQVVRRICVRLQEAVVSGSISAQVVADVQTSAMDVVATHVEVHDDAQISFDVQRLLLAEQQYYNGQLENATLSRASWRALSQGVRERLDIHLGQGLDVLASYPFDVSPNLPWIARLRSEAGVESMAVTLESLLHLKLAFKSVDAHSDVSRSLLRQWGDTVRCRLDEFQRSFPHLDVVVQHQYVANAVAVSAQTELDELHESGVIGPIVYRHAQSSIENLDARLRRETHRLLHPSFLDLLARSPLFAQLPVAALLELRDAALYHRVVSGTAVVTEGDVGDSFYLVLAGILEVRGQLFDALDSRPRLFAGSFFGEMSLLFDAPRSATVVALVDSELAEIGRDTFNRMTAGYPQLLRQVEDIARARREADTRQDAADALVSLQGALAGLRHIPLFAEAEDRTLTTVAERAVKRSFGPSEAIVREGDEGHSLYLIMEGQVQVEGTAFAQRAEMPRLGKGDFFGEMSLLFGKPRTATVRSLTNCEMLEVNRALFSELMLDRGIQAHIRELAERRLAEV